MIAAAVRRAAAARATAALRTVPLVVLSRAAASCRRVHRGHAAALQADAIMRFSIVGRFTA